MKTGVQKNNFLILLLSSTVDFGAYIFLLNKFYSQDHTGLWVVYSGLEPKFQFLNYFESSDQQLLFAKIIAPKKTRKWSSKNFENIFG
mmetsp:Transcript_12380/g.11965  ORF Transcript_12380/g.11965 Transcript_12380/m.11965 type:complete len:88 (+) Transcript_12380:3-266(+)